MPTGYTADLESKNYNVKKWLKENVIRAMGICMSLRDEGAMSEEEIARSLGTAEEIDSYHTTKLKEAKQELERFLSQDQTSLSAEFFSLLAQADQDFEKSYREFNQKKLNHLKALTETTAMYNRAVTERQGELIVNTLKFAVDQLKQAFDFDYGHGPYRPEILDQSFEQWKESKLSSLKWSVTYHSEQAEKETTRTSDRAELYQKFVNFVDQK